MVSELFSRVWLIYPHPAGTAPVELAARRGKKRALVAIARTMLVSAWHILTYRQPYRDLGGDYFDQRKKETKVNYLTRQLEKLTGGAVRIELQTATA